MVRGWASATSTTPIDSTWSGSRRTASGCSAGEIRLRELSLVGGEATVLRARYTLGSHEGSTEGRGRGVVAAHADLRERLAVDRLRLGAVALIERGR
jgi:hypothetical protein